ASPTDAATTNRRVRRPGRTIVAESKPNQRQSLPSDGPYFHKPQANRALVDLLGRIAQRKNARPAQVALAWLLAQKDRRGMTSGGFATTYQCTIVRSRPYATPSINMRHGQTVAGAPLAILIPLQDGPSA